MREIYLIDEMKLDIVPFLDAGKQFLMNQTWLAFVQWFTESNLLREEDWFSGGL